MVEVHVRHAPASGPNFFLRVYKLECVEEAVEGA